MGSLEMILVVYYFSGFGALLLGLYYLWKKRLFKKAIEINKQLPRQAYIYALVSGSAGVLCHGFFIISLTMANKGGVSLLYESWPVIAVVATPFLMRKTWKEVSLTEFVISLIALIGVAMIILSDESINLKEGEAKLLGGGMDIVSLGGYILAFAGGYMCAVLVVTKGVFSEYFLGLKNNVAAVFMSEIYSRTISMVLMTVVFMVVGDKFDFATVDWGAAFYIGFVVFVVGGALYTFSLMETDRPTIHILYYFVPVLAVVWLWGAGEATINMWLFIGGGIITLCNIYLVYAGRKAKFSEPLYSTPPVMGSATPVVDGKVSGKPSRDRTAR
jgi:drug/metabolite transporter (DMT)-like permease